MKHLSLSLASALLIGATAATAATPGGLSSNRSGRTLNPAVMSLTETLPAGMNHSSEELGRILLEGSLTPEGHRDLPGREEKILKPTKRMPAARKSLSGASFRGWMGFTETEDCGFYQVDTDGSYKQLWTNLYATMPQFPINIQSGWVRDDKLCGLAVLNVGGLIFSYNYVEFDLETGDALTEISVGPNNTIDMATYYISAAYVPSENRIYGFSYTNDDMTEIRFSSSSADYIGDVTTIKIIEDKTLRANALCYNEVEDMFYGVTFGGDFVRIDRQGNIEKIFNVDPDDVIRNEKTAIVYSALDDCYYYTPSYYRYCSQLFRIYPERKEMQFISNFPADNQFYFLLSDSFTFIPDAPGRPELLEVNFPQAKVDGSFLYRLPSKTGDGQPLTGECDWTLYIDNVATKTGKAAAGSELTVAVDGIPQGEHVVRLSVTNAAGEGVPCVVDRYFGYGIPMAPENVVMTQASVSWDAVTESYLNGYLEMADMRYDVYVNNEFIGSTDKTSMDLNLDANAEYQAYHCYVAANCHGQVSERTESNKVLFGAPFPLPLDIVPTQAQADLTYSINADGGPWYGEWDFHETRWHEPVFYSGYSNDGKCDDWLILPPVAIDDLSHSYRVTLDAICGGLTGKDERFEVWCGSAPTIEAMTTLIIPETSVHEFITEGWETFSNLFVPKQKGACYVAIRSVSPEGQYSLIIRKIKIEATDEAANVPMAPEGLEITGVSDANLTATIMLTTPKATISGNEIKDTDDLKLYIGVEGKMVEKAVKPGEELEVTVPTNQGDNRIEAYCSLDGQAGQSASVTIFTGTIPPNYVENLEGKVSEDNMSIELTWEPPLGGQENLTGYYSPEGMTYWLWELVVDPEWGDSSWEPIRELGPDCKFTYTLEEGARQRIQYLGIGAANKGGLSQALLYVYHMIGTPYKPEIKEDFIVGNNGGLNYTPVRIATPSPDYSEGYWSLVFPEDVVEESWNADIPFALIGYTENAAGGLARLELPKFSTVDIKEPVFVFRLWTTEPCAPVTILARTYNESYVELYSTPIIDNGWQDLMVVLPQNYYDRPWIQIAIDATLQDVSSYAMIGDYTFGERSKTALPEIQKQSGFVFGGKGEVVALGCEGKALSVFAADGRCVGRTVKAGQDTRFKVAAGIYTVVCDGKTHKIIVR